MNAQLLALAANWRVVAGANENSSRGHDDHSLTAALLTNCARELEAALAAPKEAGGAVDGALLEAARELLRLKAMKSKLDAWEGPWTAERADIANEYAWRKPGAWEFLRSAVSHYDLCAMTKCQKCNGDPCYCDCNDAANPPGDQRQEGAIYEVRHPSITQRCDGGKARFIEHKHLQSYLSAGWTIASPPPEAAAAVGDGDGFNGNNTKLVACINALLSMDAAGALVPHGIGGHARTLLAASAKRIAAMASPTGVDEAMVERYVNAVDSHLGSLTQKQWEIERFDPAASIRRVARIGLTAALAARDGGAKA